MSDGPQSGDALTGRRIGGLLHEGGMARFEDHRRLPRPVAWATPIEFIAFVAAVRLYF